jgi:glycosyltransferase involved in cell wall biosynthesis
MKAALGSRVQPATDLRATPEVLARTRSASAETPRQRGPVRRDKRRLLFIVNCLPLDPNYSGAAARFAQNFAAVRTLCDEVHVVRVHNRETIQPMLEFEAGSLPARTGIESADSWSELDQETDSRPHNRLSALKRSIFDPVSFQFPGVNALAAPLGGAIAEIKPDLIWVEGTDLAAAVSRLPVTTPWIFSNHDLLYRVRQIRYGVKSGRDQWLVKACRRAEIRTVRAATCVLTGSESDRQRLAEMNCRAVRVIPVAYDADSALLPTAQVPKDLRLVHLGSLETTANRIGLESYMRKAHSSVVDACRERGIEPQLWIIGDASRLKEPLTGLLKRSDTFLKNFVPDLSTVLRPFDLSILPYEHDTGYRTKLPLLLKHSQIVVATRAAVMGTQTRDLEAVCVILDRLEEFPGAIARLAADHDYRQRLGRAARAHFERHFTAEATLGEYRELLDSIATGEGCRS